MINFVVLFGLSNFSHMKKILFVCSFFGLSTVLAQKSEDLVPSEAITVFSLNNIQLLQKISMDQLVQYDFMEELQQELFDGSTNNKTIKDSGLDFDQKISRWLQFRGKSA